MDAGGAALNEAADPFAPVAEVAALLQRFNRPWFISGGWAIDLFLNRVTRGHEDVDVAIFRRDQRELQTYLAGWTVDKVEEGRRTPWQEREWLNLPVHEIHARRAGETSSEIEFLMNEAADDHWVFRRDARIQRPISKSAMRSPSGIPFLAPMIVLLYKAKNPTAKDEADFERVRPRLGFTRRLWLRGALETSYPGHPWLARL
jgi:hypothetical protein